jgi:hypothetical protein
VSECRSCGAPVLWARSEKGRWMIFDREPYTGDAPQGLFVLREPAGGQTAPTAMAAPADAFPEEAHYIVHQATCPDVEQWRR